MVARRTEALIDQQDNPPIGFRPNDPAGCLKDPVDARVHVGKFEPRPERRLVIIADQFLLHRNAGQPYPHDNRPAKPLPDEVDALSEDAAHDGETDQRLGVVT